MIRVTLRELVEHTAGTSAGVDLPATIRDIVIDSREVEDGTLFVALPGTRSHGHNYLAEVWKRGGVALVENSYTSPGPGPVVRVESPLEALDLFTRAVCERRKTRVVAVTGSIGKTSVKELVAAALGTAYVTGKSQGNYNTAIGLPLSYFRSHPDMTHFVAEMGMRALGEIFALTKILPPNVAVLTNIGPNHLETLGTQKNIQRAKGEILLGMKPDGVAVLNFEDDLVRELAQTIPGRKILWYGHKEGDAVVTSADVQGTCTVVNLQFNGCSYSISLPWLGAHHGVNVAAAFLAAVALGESPDDVVKGLEAVDGGVGRLQVSSLGTLTILADYYNASPLSMAKSLDLLENYGRADDRKVAVLGDMLELGSQEVRGHWEVGRLAGVQTDVVLAVGTRARGIADGAQGLGSHVEWVPDRNAAFVWLKDHLAPGSVVLLKASNGMMFEDLHQRLKEWGGAR